MKRNLKLLPFILFLAGCEPPADSANSREIEQSFTSMKTGDDTMYLRNQIYNDELKPFVSLIKYVSSPPDETRPQMYTYKMKEGGIVDMLNLLLPLEGIYTVKNCPKTITNNTTFFFLPTILAYNTLIRTPYVDPTSIKKTALSAKLKQTILQSLNENGLFQNAVKSALTQQNLPFNQENAIAYLTSGEDVARYFFNPKAIYCVNATREQLQGLEAEFVRFNQRYKPLDFNKIYLKGYEK